MADGLGEWITTTEGEALTGYSAVTLRQYAREGKIKGRKRGRDWFVNRGDLLDYVAKMDELGPLKHSPTRPKDT